MARNNKSEGNYHTREDARTFEAEFYYINFLDEDGWYDEDHSEQIDDEDYAHNRAKWLARNSWALSDIDYQVESIGVYSSLEGYVESYEVE